MDIYAEIKPLVTKIKNRAEIVEEALYLTPRQALVWRGFYLTLSGSRRLCKSLRFPQKLFSKKVLTRLCYCIIVLLS